MPFEDFPTTLREFDRRFGDEFACWNHLRELKWPDGGSVAARRAARDVARTRCFQGSLDGIARDGARRMLQATLLAEADVFVALHAGVVGETTEPHAFNPFRRTVSSATPCDTLR